MDFETMPLMMPLMMMMMMKGEDASLINIRMCHTKNLIRLMLPKFVGLTMVRNFLFVNGL